MRESSGMRPLYAFLPALAVSLTACGGSDAPLTQLSAATPAVLRSCADLPQTFHLANTTITGAALVPAGTLRIADSDVREHCLVTGRMFERTSPVDGQNYAIGFEMRLPTQWNGRFFHQANGGTDGNVVTATGVFSGGGPVRSGLSEGFAVLSSDAGHNSSQNPLFGRDPQARLDYGYEAVGKLTPMAKALIATAYGKGPDRSYLVGGSNGGRHALVGASRYPNEYDGILAGNPGFNLPKSGVAMLYAAQQFNQVATNPQDLATSFTPAERALVANRILEKCDRLDGALDGIVHDSRACKTAFDLARDVPSCSVSRDGTCLSDAQKTALANVYRGPYNSAGAPLYAAFPFDPGLTSSNWASWRFTFPTTLSAGNMAMIFQSPPAPVDVLQDRKAFALAFDLDVDAPKILASDALYSVSAMSFMAPPNPSDLSALRNRGGKLIVYHGAADGTFSTEDTAAWYDGVRAASPADGADFSQLFFVPGMAHCSAGPSTDQFDLVTALVDWVEHGRAPAGLRAQARGQGNPGGRNADVPADWSPTRTRPLCAYPTVARYNGQGSIEDAANFSCR